MARGLCAKDGLAEPVLEKPGITRPPTADQLVDRILEDLMNQLVMFNTWRSCGVHRVQTC